MTLIFNLLFRHFFVRDSSFGFHSLLCDFNSMSYSYNHEFFHMVNFSRKPEVLNESEEVFQSVQHSVLLGYRSINSNFDTNFVHIFLNCKRSLKILCRTEFSNSVRELSFEQTIDDWNRQDIAHL